MRIEDLTIQYAQSGYVVRPIDRLNVTANDGELVLLLGPSGSGKTTLLSCLAGILSPFSGQIFVGETEVTALRGRALAEYRRHGVGIVFQAFNLVPSLTARDNVAIPLRLAGVSAKKARDRATKLLDQVGMQDRMNYLPRALSGGQQQRVAIARALVHDPPLVVADEPTAHLDYVQVEAVLRLIRDLAAPGRLVVVATHDERFSPLADRPVELVQRVAKPSHGAERVSLTPGEVLFRQGSMGDLVYVVDEGEIEVFRQGADGSDNVVGTFGPGQYFGELGPLVGLPRSASARARTPATLTGYGVREFRRWRAGAEGARDDVDGAVR
jgi:putative ABC transport system ATP-binding protein